MAPNHHAASERNRATSAARGPAAPTGEQDERTSDEPPSSSEFLRDVGPSVPHNGGPSIPRDSVQPLVRDSVQPLVRDIGPSLARDSRHPSSDRHSASRTAAPAVVRPLPSVRDDHALVQGLRDGDQWARAALFDRCAPDVERILRRILGYEIHTDMADLVHDTFVQALASIDQLRDAGALRGWMQSIAAHTAYRTIRSRKVRRWLRFWEPSQIPEVPVEDVNPDVREAYRRTYQALDRLPVDERIAFVLRYVEGMDLGQLAETCRVSLSTIKRRLARAEERFARWAKKDEVLCTWLQEGGRWTT